MSAPAQTSGPTFGVITAAYNCADTIGETVASVLAQDYPAWEMVVIDDGSTDDTAAVAKRVAAGDPRVRVVSQPNAGRGAARNAAAALTSAPFLGILDGDDLYEPDYLSSQYAAIGRYPDRDIYSCNGHYLYPSGARLLIWRGARYRRDREYTIAEMLHRDEILNTAVVRRETFERVGGYDPSVYVEDYDLWMRILASGGRHAFSPARVVTYRIAPGSVSTRRDAIERSRLQMLESLRDGFPKIDRELIEQAITAQRGRLEVAEMEHRLVAGDARGARGIFFRNIGVLPTAARRIVGGTTMLLHPALYRKVFLRRLVRSGESGAVSGS